MTSVLYQTTGDDIEDTKHGRSQCASTEELKHPTQTPMERAVLRVSLHDRNRYENIQENKIYRHSPKNYQTY